MTKSVQSVFQINDPSLESQWRAIILFGKNSATYKFAFARALLDLVDKETTYVSLDDLAKPYSKYLVEHLKNNDKQGNSKSSTFLNGCRSFINNEISEQDLFELTKRYGFANVIDAFQNIGGGTIPDIFYEKDFSSSFKRLVITDNLLRLKENFHFQNFHQETEARWNLVETAWNLNINPNLLEVHYDNELNELFIESDKDRRVNITSIRDALNGYQKGKCFYSFQDISINPNTDNICDVDHFIPLSLHPIFVDMGININGVWNLVLADSSINRNSKSSNLPAQKYLDRLHNRNEFYISSKHPLAETIINQTGNTPKQRVNFLNHVYQKALNKKIVTWKPDIELIGNF